MAPGMAGIPRENTRRIQSLRPKVILRFDTTIKNAAEENKYNSNVIIKIPWQHQHLSYTTESFEFYRNTQTW